MHFALDLKSDCNGFRSNLNIMETMYSLITGQHSLFILHEAFSLYELFWNLFSFNDRIRDAMLGGSPFGHPLQQGFVTGLFLQVFNNF